VWPFCVASSPRWVAQACFQQSRGAGTDVPGCGAEELQLCFSSTPCVSGTLGAKRTCQPKVVSASPPRWFYSGVCSYSPHPGLRVDLRYLFVCSQEVHYRGRFDIKLEKNEWGKLTGIN